MMTGSMEQMILYQQVECRQGWKVLVSHIKPRFDGCELVVAIAWLSNGARTANDDVGGQRVASTVIGNGFGANEGAIGAWDSQYVEATLGDIV